MRATASPLRFVRAIMLVLGSLVAWALAGCVAFSTDVARVSVAPAPSASSEARLAVLPDDDGRLPLVFGETGRFTEPRILKFFAAREAFWNYDTETAARLLRELRQEEVMSAPHFHDVLLRCYELSGRWADTLPLYAEFGLDDGYRERLEFSRFMSSLPPRQIELTAKPMTVPMELQDGDWVVVEGAVNGVKARIGLDTGCGLTWMSERFARRAQVEVRSQTISLSDANGASRDVPLALVRELSVGGLTVRNMPAMTGRSLMNNIFARVDVILGWEILQHVNVAWNFPAKRMTLSAPAAGPLAKSTNLSGRVAPIVTVRSASGRPLGLFFDSGAHGNRRNAITLFSNGGVLATKTPLGEFRTSWLPTVGAGLHSLTMSWPRRSRPFSLWLDGHRFELTAAVLQEKEHRQEDLILLDGVIGNAPFLGGTLTFCGVRREFSFEPRSQPPAGREGSTAK